MAASILVAYATRSGSTQETAEAIAATLRDSGAAVELRPAKEVRSLEGYGSVVLGAPLYMFHWHKDAIGFLNRHQATLTRMPVAVFALGPFSKEEKEWREIRLQFDTELGKLPWLMPMAKELFGGKFDPTRLRFPMNLVPALKNMPASDIRDWDVIRGWAGRLAAKL